MTVLYFDTDMDVTPELARRYGAKLISMPYTIGDQMIYPYQDFAQFDAHAFYQSLRQGTVPSTSALNVADYKKIFEPEFKAGNDILYVHFSAAMTCSFDNLHLALQDLQAAYPQVKFYEVDTKGITVCAYYLACLAGEMYQQKKTPKEIVAALEAERDHVACYFYADNLNFFRRSGRVNNLAAFFGNILGLHPIISINDAGKMDTCAKVLGMNQALKSLVKKVHDLGDDIKNHPFIIAHTDCRKQADRLAKILQTAFGDDLSITFVDVNPTAGSHCGPDTVGVCFHAQHR